MIDRHFTLQLVWQDLDVNSFSFVSLTYAGLIGPSNLFQGIEKKTAKLKGSEKAVVARHEVGHAVVGTAVASLLPGQPRVEVNHRKYTFLGHLNMPMSLQI